MALALAAAVRTCARLRRLLSNIYLPAAAGSFYHLPLSATHTLVGAVAGVGMLEGRRGGVSAMLLVRFFAGEEGLRRDWRCLAMPACRMMRSP